MIKFFNKFYLINVKNKKGKIKKIKIKDNFKVYLIFINKLNF